MRTTESFSGRVRLCLVGLVFCAACGNAPTAPTPAVTVAAPPVVVAPPVILPPPRNPVLDDPRYDPAFYRQFALNGLDFITPLRRQTEAPRIYLRTVDDRGAPMDALTLEQTAAALINTTGQLTGAFGLAGLERGTDTREGQKGWITVRWSIESGDFCGFGVYAGDLITLYPRTTNCRCPGGPAVRLSTVKHELGHVLGFYHTDSPSDLMYPTRTVCDQQPSAREMYHASVAYARPVGSLEP